MRTFGRFLLLVSVGLWALFAATLLASEFMKEAYFEKYSSSGAAFMGGLTGESKRDENVINATIWLSRAALVGGVLTFITGTAGAIVGKN